MKNCDEDGSIGKDDKHSLLYDHIACRIASHIASHIGHQNMRKYNILTEFPSLPESRSISLVLRYEKNMHIIVFEVGCLHYNKISQNYWLCLGKVRHPE